MHPRYWLSIAFFCLGFWQRTQHNKEATELTEPQVWRLIGVFAVAMFALIGIVTSSFNRTLKATIGGVRSEISRLRDIMGARFGTDLR